jgi:hypothetical protein
MNAAAPASHVSVSLVIADDDRPAGEPRNRPNARLVGLSPAP